MKLSEKFSQKLSRLSHLKLERLIDFGARVGCRPFVIDHLDRAHMPRDRFKRIKQRRRHAYREDKYPTWLTKRIEASIPF